MFIILINNKHVFSCATFFVKFKNFFIIIPYKEQPFQIITIFTNKEEQELLISLLKRNTSLEIDQG